jgi:hypothetical protein
MNEWSHLTNGARIDQVLESFKSNERTWKWLRQEGLNNFKFPVVWWFNSYASAYDKICIDDKNEIWDIITSFFLNVDEGIFIIGSLIALVAYDDCANYLSMSSEQLKIIALIGENPAAILLLPAVIVLEKIEQEKV